MAFLYAFIREFQQKSIPAIFDSTQNFLARSFSKYEKYYLRHAIKFEHRTFDVKGLSTQNIYTLELEQVFVDLSLAPKTPHQAACDQIENLPEELQSGRHSIWDYLDIGNGKPLHLAVPGGTGVWQDQADEAFGVVAGPLEKKVDP